MHQIQNCGDDHWKHVYRAALFESNRATIPLRIAEAQQLIGRRRSELINSPNADTEERNALDHALYCLQALRTCLRSSATEAA